MATVREGGCQCGAIRYRLEGDPIVLSICHCTECQRQSGSAFGMSLVMRREHVQLSREPKVFTRSSDSGRTVGCAFCPACGTRIYHEPRYMEGVLNIKPGTLDDTSWLRPTMQVWTIRRLPWVELPAELHSFERQPG